MEQQDSVQQELQNLSRLQSEQVEILKDMSAKEDNRQAMEEARRSSEEMKNVNYSPSSVYNAFNNQMKSGDLFNGNKNNPYAEHTQSQFGTSINNLIGQQGRYSLLSSISPSSRDSLQSRTLVGMTQGSSLAQAGVAGLGGLFNLGLGIASWKLPLIPSLGVSMLGSAVIGAYTDKAIEEMKKDNAINKYLYKNSYTFINSQETNNDEATGGFSRRESIQAADFVRKMNTEFYMKDEEIMTLLQKYTEGGLLKNVHDIDSFKEKMKVLTKTVKEGALMLNETYDSIADLMAEMKKAGIDERNYEDLMSMSKILAGITGDSASDVVRNFAEFIKNFNQGTSNDSTKMSTRLTSNTVYVGEYYNQLEEGYENGTLDFLGRSNYNYMKNLGGSTQASEQFTAALETMIDNKAINHLALSFFDWNGKEWQFNAQNFEAFKNGNYTVQQLESLSQQKLQALNDSGQGNAALQWNSQAGNYIRDALTGSQLMTTIKKSMDAYLSSDAMAQFNADESTILRDYFGVTDSSMYNLIKGVINFQTQNPNLETQYALQNIWQKKATSQIAETPSFTEMISSGWEKFTDSVTQWAADLDTSLGNFFADFNMKRANIPNKYNVTFNTQSNLDSIGFDDVVKGTKETNELLASGLETLKSLEEKGYQINNEVKNFVENKYKSSDKTVSYGREVISDWSQTSSDIQEQQEQIKKQSEENSLSETIVAALTKYASQNPEFSGKVDMSKTIEDMGNYKFKYGGNEELALGAALGLTSEIDSALKKKGYDINRLNSVGAQEVVQGVTLADLGITGDTVNTVSAIQQTQIGQTQVVQQTSYSLEDIENKDIREKSNVTADDINKIIDDRTQGKNSKLKGQGQVIIDVAEKYGVDPAWVLAMAGKESGFGTEGDIANDKNNFFGYGAYEANGRSAYMNAASYNSVEDGIEAFVSGVVKNYFGRGQTSLELMTNDPNNQDNLYNSEDPNYKTEVAKIILEILTETNRGYNGEGGSSPIETKTEQVNKDTEGNNLNEKQVEQSNRKSWAEEGFSFDETDNYKKMENFLDSVNDIDTAYNKNKFVYNGNDNILSFFNNEAADIFKTRPERKYFEALNNAIKSGKYSSVEDIITQDYEVAKYREKFMSYTKDKQEAEKVFSAYEEYKFNKNKIDSGQEVSQNYKVLEVFGKTNLGLDPNDYLDNFTEYNTRLRNGSKAFYEQNLEAMTAYSTDNKDSEAYKTWESLNTIEKINTIKTAKLVGESLGLDTREMNNLSSSSNIRRLFSDKEIEQEKHLREDKNGNIIYDPEYNGKTINFDTSKIYKDPTGEVYYEDDKNNALPVIKYLTKDKNDKVIFSQTPIDESGELLNGTVTYDESSKKLYYNGREVEQETTREFDPERIVKWKEQGSKRDVVGEAMRKLGLSEDGTKYTTGELISKTEGLLNDTLEKNYEYVTKAGEYANKIMAGKYGFIEASDEAKSQYVNALASGNIDEMRRIAEQNKINVNGEALAEFEALAKSLSEIDATGLKDVLTALKQIKEMASDVGKTVELMMTDLGDKDFLGDTWTKELEKNIQSAVVNSITDSDLKEKINKGNVTADDILTLLTGGAVEGVSISTEDLQAMTEAVSKAMTTAFEEIFNNDYYLNEFSQTSTYQTIAANDANFDASVKKIKELNQAIEDFSNGTYTGDETLTQLQEEKQKLVDTVITTYQDEVQKLGKTGEDIKGVAEKSQKTAEVFSTTMEKYDIEIGKAITTMQDRITDLEVQTPPRVGSGSSWYTITQNN